MHFADVNVIGAKVIDPTLHSDDRGQFMRAWCTREFAEHDIEFLPVQANMGFSRQKGTIRGMHFQEAPALEAKLVRCTRGSFFDVANALRARSSSSGRSRGVVLTVSKSYQLCM